MNIISFRQQLVYMLLLFVLLLLLVPHAGYGGDMYYWVKWATYIFEHQLGDVYEVADNNYNPLYHYILWLYGTLMGSTEKIAYYAHWLKGFTLIFDFAGAFWAASLVTDRSRRFGLLLLLLLNMGYLYDTLIWIQVDSIYTFFSFGAIVLATRQRPVGSILLFVLALAAKTQAIIFLPPLLLLWLPACWQRPGRIPQMAFAGAALAILLVAPFVWWSWTNYLPRIIEINLTANQVYPMLSMNAFNLWYLITSYEVLDKVPDMLPFAGLTYRSWGLILFLASSAIALLPLLLTTWQALRARHAARPPGLALVLLTSGCIPLLFTFFNTQMHERYWHAAVLFLAAYGFVRRDYLPYVLVSVAYFLHLERGLRFLELLNYDVLIFRPRFIASLFALLIVLVVFKIYRLAPWRLARPSPAPEADVPALTNRN